MRQHSHLAVMHPCIRTVLLGLLIFAVGATPTPNANETNASPAPTATLTSAKPSCFARPPSCAVLTKMETICAPYLDYKKSCFRFCRQLQFAYGQQAKKCKAKNRRRFSTLFVPCLRKCAVVRRAARDAAEKGAPFEGAVMITDRLYRKYSRRRTFGMQRKSACWLCRHNRTHCGRCCGSRWWCPRWK